MGLARVFWKIFGQTVIGQRLSSWYALRRDEYVFWNACGTFVLLCWGPNARGQKSEFCPRGNGGRAEDYELAAT
jgi:hypothetical protein